MGPRSHERGNVLGEQREGAGEKASMGPRSHERGNTVFVSIVRESRKRLQWGRVLMNAETTPSRVALRGSGLASMGPRSHERGNGYRDYASTGGERDASMGPRSHERGNTAMDRDHVAGETSFNGAAFS